MFDGFAPSGTSASKFGGWNRPWGQTQNTQWQNHNQGAYNYQQAGQPNYPGGPPAAGAGTNSKYLPGEPVPLPYTRAQQPGMFSPVRNRVSPSRGCCALILTVLFIVPGIAVGERAAGRMWRYVLKHVYVDTPRTDLNPVVPGSPATGPLQCMCCIYSGAAKLILTLPFQGY